MLFANAVFSVAQNIPTGAIVAVYGNIGFEHIDRPLSEYSVFVYIIPPYLRFVKSLKRQKSKKKHSFSIFHRKVTFVIYNGIIIYYVFW